MMLLLALSQNANAKCKSTGIGLFDYLDPECGKEMDKKFNAGIYYKEIMEKQRLAKIQERQERYDAALEQMKRDNPNFKKPERKTNNTPKNEELTRDDLINYRQQTRH